MNTRLINPDACADLLRSLTDQISISFKRPDPSSTIPDIINYISQVNEWANGEMRSALGALYPDIAWNSAQEANAAQQTRPTSSSAFWVYDPIDAAYHTIQGLPLWSASLALVAGGQTVFGAVYEPAMREMFVATKGGGATLNGVPLRPPGKIHLRSAVVATFLPPFGHGDPKRHDETIRLIGTVSKRCFVVRQMASASVQLAYVAAGRLDALFEVGSTIHDWLAGALLVKEAGLQVFDLAGNAFDWEAEGILASHQSLSGALLDAIAPP